MENKPDKVDNKIADVINAIGSNLDMDSIQKYVFGNTKSGRPRALYDIIKKEKKNKRKELALISGSDSPKKKKKRKKGKKKDYKFKGWYGI